jgi:hypothetical protein
MEGTIPCLHTELDIKKTDWPDTIDQDTGKLLVNSISYTVVPIKDDDFNDVTSVGIISDAKGNANIQNLQLLYNIPELKTKENLTHEVPCKIGEFSEFSEVHGGATRMCCKNVPKGDKKKYYTGKEVTPMGRGYAACYEKVGCVKKGTDGKMYTVSKTKSGAMRWSPVATDKKEKKPAKKVASAKKSKPSPKKK